MKAIAKESSSIASALSSVATSDLTAQVPWFWEVEEDRLIVGARFNKYAPDRQNPAQIDEFLAAFSGVEVTDFTESLQRLAKSPGHLAEQLVFDYRKQPLLVSAECVATGQLMGQVTPVSPQPDTGVDQLVSNLSSPTCLWDYETGVVACNAAFEKLTGWSERQLRQLPGSETITSSGLATAIEPDQHALCAKLKAGVPVLAMVRFGDSAPTQVLFTPVHLQHQGPQLLLLECVPVQSAIANSAPVDSASALAEAAEKSQADLRQLIDQIQDIILYLDQSGNVKTANRYAQQFFKGVEALGKNLVDLFGGNIDLLRLHREVSSLVRTNKKRLGENLRVRYQGRQYWFDIDLVPTASRQTGTVDGVLMVLRDVSESVQINRQLRASEHRYQAFIANCMDGIWCCEISPPVDVTLPLDQQVDLLAERATFTECNQQMARLRDCASPLELMGKLIFEKGMGAHKDTVRSFVQANYQLVEAPIWRHMQDGRRLELTVSTMGIVEDQKLVHVWGITRDVTEKFHQMARMEYQANHDSLTGLPNRHSLYNTINASLQKKSAEQVMALLLIDLNRFKDLNDTLGHQVGDTLLKQVGPRIHEELPEHDAFIARLGGDEFAIFLSSIRNPQQAVVLAHRVLDAIKQPYDLDGFHTEIGAAIGIAIRPTMANDVSHLMRFADVAMYQAKSEVSNVVVYSAAKDPHQVLRFSLISELRRAIRQQELVLNFQPKIELKSERLHGFEALVRWQHPTHGFIPPSEFIPMAEATDVIHPLTEWVLEQSIQQCKRWHDQDFYVTVAVNLSARNLLDEKLPHKVFSLLKKYALPALSLELEITESAIVVDPDRALMVLNQLSEKGVRLSIDDFGTGYSSLAYLKKLPVNALKIDRSFVMDMLTNHQDRVIVKSTINLAHNLGLHVVAEGVENEESLQTLRQLGCNQAQGYHLGRPMQEGQVLDWFRASPWKADAES